MIGQVLTAGCLLGQVAFSSYWMFLALFIVQGVGMACVSGSDTALLYDLLVRRGATAGYVKINSRFTMLGTVTSGVAIVLGGQLQRISWAIVYVGSAACLVLAVVVLMSRVPEIRGADAVAQLYKGRAQAARTALVDGKIGVAVILGGRLRIALRVMFRDDRIVGIEALADPEQVAALDVEVLEG